MGRFDKLFTYLGEEGKFSPNEIERGVDKITPVGEADLGAEEASEESLANVDDLLDTLGDLPGMGPDPASELSVDDTATEPTGGNDLDLGDLGDFGTPEEASGDFDDLGMETPSDEDASLELSDFGSEKPETGDGSMDFGDLGDFGGETSNEAGGQSPSDDFSGLGDFAGGDSESADDFGDLSDFSSSDSGDSDDGLNDFLSELGSGETSGGDAFSDFGDDLGSSDALGETADEDFSIGPEPMQPAEVGTTKETEIDLDGLDLQEEVIEELRGLDTAPPPVSDIEKGGAGMAEEEMIEEMLAGAAGNNGGGDFDFDSVSMESTMDPFAGAAENSSGEPSGDLGDFGDFGDNADEGIDEDMGDFLSGMNAPGENPPANDFNLSGENASATEDLGSDFGFDLPSNQDSAADFGDLGESSSDDFGDLGESASEDFGDFGDFGESSSDDFSAEMGNGPNDDFIAEEFSGVDDDFGEINTGSADAGLDDSLDLGGGFDSDDLSGDEFDEPTLSTAFDSDDELPEVSSFSSALSSIEMDEDKAFKIRERINHVPDGDFRKRLRNVFLNSLIPSEKLEQLIAMLLVGDSVENIREFLDNIAPEEEISEDEVQEDELEASPRPKQRRVIYASDAQKAEELQKNLLSVTKYAVILAVSLIAAGILLYKFVVLPVRANKRYEEGLQYIATEEYTKAETKFEKGIDINGTNYTWINTFANAYLDEDEEDRAVTKWEDGLLSDFDNEEIILEYGDYLRDEEDYETAIDLYSRLVDEDYSDFDVVDLIGMTYIDWAENDPENSDTYFEAAKELYSRYAAGDQEDVRPSMKLLLIAIRQDDEDRIAIMYDSIQKIEEGAVDIPIYTELAEYYTDNREMDKAKELYTLLITEVDRQLSLRNKEKRPQGEDRITCSEAYFQYARYLTYGMDYVRARMAASNSIILNTNDAKPVNLLGELAYINETLTNNVELAMQYYESAIDLDEEYYLPYANLGHVYYYDAINFDDEDSLNTAYTKALNYYEMAVLYLPDDVEDELLSFNLGWLYYRNANYESAFDYWAPLYREDPFNPVLCHAMANTYYHQNQPGLALTQYEKAIDYYNELIDGIAYVNSSLERHQEIFMRLARCYNNRGAIYAEAALNNTSAASTAQAQALLDFFRAKNAANEIDEIYPEAEENMIYLQNQTGFGQRAPSFDEEIPSRTTLQKWLDEFEDNLIERI